MWSRKIEEKVLLSSRVFCFLINLFLIEGYCFTDFCCFLSNRYLAKLIQLCKV